MVIVVGTVVFVCYVLFRSPQYQKDIELVEGVQRRATKLIDEVRNLHYEERIKKI